MSYRPEVLSIPLNLWSVVLTSLYQVPNANIIHWEIGSCCSILWTHIGNGGSVSNGQLGNTRTKKLHKFTHHSDLAKMLL